VGTLLTDLGSAKRERRTCWFTGACGRTSYSRAGVLFFPTIAKERHCDTAPGEGGNITQAKELESMVRLFRREETELDGKCTVGRERGLADEKGTGGEEKQGPDRQRGGIGEDRAMKKKPRGKPRNNWMGRTLKRGGVLSDAKTAAGTG